MECTHLRCSTQAATIPCSASVSGRGYSPAAFKKWEPRNSCWGSSSIAFEPGDSLLGWQDDEAAVRYCHEADDGEIGRLVAALGRRMPDTHVVDRFKSDGRTGDLNAYIVLKRA